jgi:hypothetical protein
MGLGEKSQDGSRFKGKNICNKNIFKYLKKMTTALSFNSNYMQDDKQDTGKRNLALYLALGFAGVLGITLFLVELWLHYRNKGHVNK